MLINKRRIMLKFVLLVAMLFLFISLPWPIVSAQDEVASLKYNAVNLWIYPEFDDPRLLVMLQGRIVGAEPPAIVRFLVPSTAEMYSAGSMDSQGQYTGGPPDREPSSIPGWDEISYELQTDTFRVEYYDSIIIGEQDKTISYDFRWLYPISDVTVTIQEPRTSTDFIVSPGGQVFTDGYGLTAHLYNYEDLNEAQPLSFEISYTKSDTRPSLSITDDGSSGYWYIVIIVVVVGILIGTYFLFIKSRPEKKSARPAKVKGTARKPEKNRTRNTPRDRFCTQCGYELDRTHRFCPNCGKER